jgi:hypothetical protein
MKLALIRLLLPLLLTATTTTLSALEPIWRYAVEASATVSDSPAKITLSWVADAYATSYTISRKAPSDTSWKKLASLAGDAATYEDTSVEAHRVYEYQIQKAGTQETSYTGYGYVQTAIDAPLVDNRGRIVLLIDSTYAADLSAELTRLQQDLVGDGWTVLRHDVSRTDTPDNIKAIIRADYDADPNNTTAVFLFGHVPVPYSGAIAPDGHAAHKGAWPADAFYGDMNGRWTDLTTNFISTSTDISQEERDRLTNIPRDGKYDPSTIPAAVVLQVGRVDLADMPGYLSWQADPSFPSEVDLLRNYLNKDHAYRQRVVTIPRRSLIGQYLGMRGGEAFAATGFRAFTSFFGAGPDVRDLNVEFNDQQGVWVPALANDTYLWAYGDGGGSYSSVMGLGNTGEYHGATSVDFVSNDIHSTFVVLFGSWMGDWNTEDNLLRSVLATPTNGLAAVWSGRPHWFFHPMALGETIGYCARLTQNNDKLYRNQINSSTRGIHIALMGDPTLRLFPVQPPSSVQASINGNTATLTWSGSSEATLGYHVYRADSAAGPYRRITNSPTGATTFTDTSYGPGAAYMVRAIKLETSASGTYENASEGAFVTP